MSHELHTHTHTQAELKTRMLTSPPVDSHTHTNGEWVERGGGVIDETPKTHAHLHVLATLQRNEQDGGAREESGGVRQEGRGVREEGAGVREEGGNRNRISVGAPSLYCKLDGGGSQDEVHDTQEEVQKAREALAAKLLAVRNKGYGDVGRESLDPAAATHAATHTATHKYGDVWRESLDPAAATCTATDTATRDVWRESLDPAAATCTATDTATHTTPRLPTTPPPPPPLQHTATHSTPPPQHTAGHATPPLLQHTASHTASLLPPGHAAGGGGGGARGRGGGEEVDRVEMRLSLGMDFSAAGSAGSAERSAFEHELKIDLSNASAAMPTGALQCVAVCCNSVLQCAAVCCSVLQCIHTHHQLVQSNASAASYAAKKSKTRVNCCFGCLNWLNPEHWAVGFIFIHINTNLKRCGSVDTCSKIL